MKSITYTQLNVRLVLNYLKFQTRREMTPQPTGQSTQDTEDWYAQWKHAVADSFEELSFACPYGKRGDQLWVREAWRVPQSLDAFSGKEIGEMSLSAGYQKPWAPIQYEADKERRYDWRNFEMPPKPSEPGRYRHARFMPQWASRILLDIVDIRVERLQEISEADAIAEGCTPAGNGYFWGAVDPEVGRLQFATAVRAYRSIWESINGDGSWNVNPWVWVVTFKRALPGSQP